MQLVRPSSLLRNKYQEMSNLCKETKEAIIITVNGYDDTVLINSEVYRKQLAELELLSKLLESQNDIIANKLSNKENYSKEIEAFLETL